MVRAFLESLFLLSILHGAIPIRAIPKFRENLSFSFGIATFTSQFLCDVTQSRNHSKAHHDSR
jgi:hypothetical protein